MVDEEEEAALREEEEMRAREEARRHRESQGQSSSSSKVSTAGHYMSAACACLALLCLLLLLRASVLLAVSSKLGSASTLLLSLFLSYLDGLCRPSLGLRDLLVSFLHLFLSLSLPLSATQQHLTFSHNSFPQYREVQSTGSVVQEEDVMSTFDPYGTNLYKGMRVAGDVGQGQEEVETMAKKGEKVGFKKRKKAGTSSAAEEGTGPGAGSSSSAKGHNTASGASMSVSCGGRSASASAGTSDGYNSVKIKSENGTQDPYQQAPVLEEIYIKSEIKLEPGIKVEESDSDRPPTKMSFGFKHRNTRKSADDN